MIFGAFKQRVYNILQDNPTAPLRFTDASVAFYATEAIRELINTVGRYTTRTSINLVQSQQSYLLPADVYRILKVQLIPESGANEEFNPLNECELWEIPNTTITEQDPVKYAVEASDDSNPDQMSIFMWPSPGRSATDAIVVDYERSETVTSGDDNLVMPFKEEFAFPVMYLTAAGMLAESDDGIDIQKAAMLKAEGKVTLGKRSRVGGLFYEPVDRKAYP